MAHTVQNSLLGVTNRAMVLSVLLHLAVPVFFVSFETLEIAPTFKRKNRPDQMYQSYVQVDVVALPEKVGISNKFVDPRLPIVKNPKIAAPAQKAQAKEETSDPDEMTLAEKLQKRKAEEKKRKAAEERKRKAKAKKEAARKKKARAEAKKKALADLKRRIERERAIKELAKGSAAGREAIRGNVLSKGTSTTGKVGSAREVYDALVQQAFRKNFNVMPFMTGRGLETLVNIRISPQGRPTSWKIEKSSGDELYDSAVLQAVSETRNVPLPQDAEIRDEIMANGVNITFKP